MRRTIILGFCLFVLVMWSFNVRSSASETDSSKDSTKTVQDALQYFLDQDHEDVIPKALEKLDKRDPSELSRAFQEVLKFQKELEPLFIQILNQGPSAGVLAKVLRERRQFFEDQWSRRAAFLARQSSSLGLDEDEIKIAQSLTSREYVEQALEQLIRRYREKSAIALGTFAIGEFATIVSPEATRALRGALDKIDDPVLKKIIEKQLSRAAGSQDKSSDPPPAPPTGLRIQ